MTDEFYLKIIGGQRALVGIKLNERPITTITDALERAEMADTLLRAMYHDAPVFELTSHAWRLEIEDVGREGVILGYGNPLSFFKKASDFKARLLLDVPSKYRIQMYRSLLFHRGLLTPCPWRVETMDKLACTK